MAAFEEKCQNRKLEESRNGSQTQIKLKWNGNGTYVEKMMTPRYHCIVRNNPEINRRILRESIDVLNLKAT